MLLISLRRRASRRSPPQRSKGRTGTVITRLRVLLVMSHRPMKAAEDSLRETFSMLVVQSYKVLWITTNKYPVEDAGPGRSELQELPGEGERLASGDASLALSVEGSERTSAKDAAGVAHEAAPVEQLRAPAVEEKEHSSAKDAAGVAHEAAPVEQLRAPPVEEKEHTSAKDTAGVAHEAAPVEQLRAPPVEEKEHTSAKDAAGVAHEAAPVEQLRAPPVEEKGHTSAKDAAGVAHEAAPVEQLRAPPVEEKEHTSAKDAAGVAHEAAPVEQLRAPPDEEKEHTSANVPEGVSHGTSLNVPQASNHAKEAKDATMLTQGIKSDSETTSAVGIEKDNISVAGVVTHANKDVTLVVGHQEMHSAAENQHSGAGHSLDHSKSDGNELLRTHSEGKAEIASKVRGEPACDRGADPFEGQSVEFFVPPGDAPMKLRSAWKQMIADMLQEVSRMKVGGQILRDVMNEKVAEMKVKRYEMFCSFVCGDKCSL